MTTKFLSQLFCLLAVINIPIMVFFSRGDGIRAGVGEAGIFSSLSLGNLGTVPVTCDDKVNLQNFWDTNSLTKAEHDASMITVNCGEGSSLENLIALGLPSNKSTTCTSLSKLYLRTYNVHDLLMEGCHLLNKTSLSNELFKY